MGEEDPTITPHDPTSFSLPPGSRFHPSEQQLICYYLTSKNNGTDYHGIDVIKEIDLYNFDPFNLPESACFRFGSRGRRRHWYCYVGRRVLKETGRRRAAGCGYWKKRSRVRDVVWGAGVGKVVVGTRKSFDFYLRDSPSSAIKTHWVMYEYALTDHHHMGPFVLCRLFYKSHPGNILSEHIISSCGEESVAAVRHMGVQFDGTVKNSNDDDNKVLKIPTGEVNEFDGNIIHKPVSEQDMISILEEDYIELNDLLCPLPETD